MDTKQNLLHCAACNFQSNADKWEVLVSPGSPVHFVLIENVPHSMDPDDRPKTRAVKVVCCPKCMMLKASPIIVE